MQGLTYAAFVPPLQPFSITGCRPQSGRLITNQLLQYRYEDATPTNIAPLALCFPLLLLLSSVLLLLCTRHLQTCWCAIVNLVLNDI